MSREGFYKKWQSPENLTLLKGWRRDGLTMKQIAGNIGIRRQTLYKWCVEYQDIGDALKKGAEICNYEVENSLYKAAIGYDVTETEQTETIGPDGSKTVVKRARKRHVAPNVGAICFILKNRLPDKWRDNPIVEDNRALETLQAILDTTKQAVKDGADVQQETEDVHTEGEQTV